MKDKFQLSELKSFKNKYEYKLNITWNNKPLHHELNTYNEKNQSTINYLDDKENFDYLDYPSTDNESTTEQKPIDSIVYRTFVDKFNHKYSVMHFFSIFKNIFSNFI